jgi:hypothetical protein
MKALLFFLLTICFCSPALDKIKKADLNKYSYEIIGFFNDEPIAPATCFIVEYKAKYFLVTNYHVMTGINFSTGQKIEKLKSIFNSVVVMFRYTDHPRLTYTVKYNIYHNLSTNFGYYINEKGGVAMDLAVMPITIPNDALLFTIKEKDIDSSGIKKDGINLSIVGFSNPVPENDYQPITTKTKSVVGNPSSNYGELYYKDSSFPGTSGAPVYQSLNDNYKVVGINLGALNGGTVDKKPFLGIGIPVKYLHGLLDLEYNNTPIVGVNYQRK